MSDPAPIVRAEAARGLRFAGALGVPTLRAALKDDDAKVREVAAEALGFMGWAAGPAAPDLVRALDQRR